MKGSSKTIASIASIHILALGYFLINQNALASDPVDRQDFLAAYARSAAELEQFYSEVQGSAILTTEVRIGDPSESREDYDLKFWISKEQMRVDKIWKHASSGHAEGQATTYVSDTSRPYRSRAFRIDHATPKSQFRLKYHGPSIEDCEYNIYDCTGRFLTAPYAIDGEPIERLLTEPTFQLLGITTLNRGDDRVRLQFDYRPKFPRPRTLGGGISDAFERLEGWLILAPADKWCLVEYEIKMTRKKEKTSFVRALHMEYGDKQMGIPVIRRVVSEWKDVKPLRYTLQISDITHAASPAEKFKTGPFGFPELDDASQDNRASILLLTGFSILVLAILLNSWRNRSRQATKGDVNL